MRLQNGFPYGYSQEALASQKIAISSSTGPGNGSVSGTIDIYHIALHI